MNNNYEILCTCEAGKRSLFSEQPISWPELRVSYAFDRCSYAASLMLSDDLQSDHGGKSKK